MAEIQIIRPGDVLLVRMSGSPTPEMFDQFHQSLSEKLPGVKVLTVSSVDGFDIYRSEG